MKRYTYQIGVGANHAGLTAAYSEELHADSLGEAIDKAKAITKLRPVHTQETTVRLIDAQADDYSLWASSAEAIRKG